MEFLQQAVVLLLTLAVLIAFHEYGHFIVARLCGVKVLRFSIGFGPVLARWVDKKGTEFAISALPLGGYVKMLDGRELELEESEKHQAFNLKDVKQRMAIVSAGPIANFLLAIAIYWLVFLQGTTGLLPQIFSVTPGSIAEQAGLQQGMQIIAVDGKSTETARDVLQVLMRRIGETGSINFDVRLPSSDVSARHQLKLDSWLSSAEDQVDILGSLGLGFYQPQLDAVIDKVMADSAAAHAGLQAQDKIISADGQPMDDWQTWVDYIVAHPLQAIELVVERDNRQIPLQITPQSIVQDGRTVGRAGVSVSLPKTPENLIVKKHYSLIGAFVPAVNNTWNMAVFNLRALKKMVVGDLSYKQLSGPISIAKVVTESTHFGIYSYLSLLALLSVSLGVLNLLPIPVLDGGHLLFYIIEWVFRRPVPEKVQAIAFQLGMYIVLSVMLLAVFNDLGRL